MRYSHTTGCFYPNDITYTRLPEDLIPVSEEDFTAAMARNPGDLLDVVNGRVVVMPGPGQTAEKMWEKIKTERNDRMSGGFKIEVETGIYKWFHSDTASRIQHLGLFMLGASIPAIPWKTMDGSFVTMTQTIAGLIFQEALTLDSTLFTVAEQHKAAMEAASDPAYYDYSVGWPERFGD